MSNAYDEASTDDVQMRSAGTLCSYCQSQGKSVSYKICSQCRNALYCSRDCQKKHWKVHKRECATLATRRTDAKSRGDAKAQNKKASDKNCAVDLDTISEPLALTEASGVGHIVFVFVPKMYLGQMKHKFTFQINSEGREGTMEFASLAELDPQLRLFLYCGFLNDLEAAKAILPEVLTGMQTRMPSGTTLDQLRLPHGLRLLDHAARRGNREICEWLCTLTPASKGGMLWNSAAVAWAVYTGGKDLAKILIGLGADPSYTEPEVFNCKPPLFLAAENAKLGCVKYLIEEVGLDINMREEKHGGDLLGACFFGMPSSAITENHRQCHAWVQKKMREVQQKMRVTANDSLATTN